MKYARLPNGVMMPFDDDVDDPSIDQIVQGHLNPPPPPPPDAVPVDPQLLQIEGGKAQVLTALTQQMAGLNQKLDSLMAFMQQQAQMHAQQGAECVARNGAMVDQIMGALSSLVGTISATGDQIERALTAPKTVETDAAGNVTGVRVAGGK